MLLSHANPLQFWSAIALIVFALAFFIVGLTRVVEFNGLGLSLLRRRVLVVMHCVGCALFATSLGLLGVDLDRTFQPQMGALLLSSLILLFPVHIYAGLLRRIEWKRRQGAGPVPGPVPKPRHERA